MRLVGREKLDEFSGAHADARPWIANWKRSYASASFLADKVVIFNVKGNSYRLEVQVAYKTGTVVVRWIGTHAEYTKRTG